MLMTTPQDPLLCEKYVAVGVRDLKKNPLLFSCGRIDGEMSYPEIWQYCSLSIINHGRSGLYTPTWG